MPKLYLDANELDKRVFEPHHIYDTPITTSGSNGCALISDMYGSFIMDWRTNEKGELVPDSVSFVPCGRR